MTLFFSTLNQMAFLFLFIIVGYIVSRLRAVPDNTATVLSKLENTVFIPALVLSTFMQNFTIARIGQAWQYLVVGLGTVLLMVPLSIFSAKCCTRDRYLQKIYSYGLSFPNFAFMGNAVVSALFPNEFMGYLIFTLPFWTLIYLWGVPKLLIPESGEKKSLLANLKSFVNPMFAATLLGMVLGLISPPIPAFISSTVTSLGSCMSPIAMLLTGMTIAKIDMKKTFKSLSLYAISIVRLIAFPLVFIFALSLLPLPYGPKVCVACLVAMPLGLNTIVVPAAYGQDTSAASGLALISHLLSCATIPLMFMLFARLVAA